MATGAQYNSKAALLCVGNANSPRILLTHFNKKIIAGLRVCRRLLEMRLRLLLSELNPVRRGEGGEGAAGEAFAAARATESRMPLTPLPTVDLGGLDELLLWRLSVRRTARARSPSRSDNRNLKMP